MSQQPQPRPWFRLASLARSAAPPPPAPALAPVMAPRPPFIRPTFTQTFAPPPPPPPIQPAQPPPSPPTPTPPSPPQALIQKPPSPPSPILSPSPLPYQPPPATPPPPMLPQRAPATPPATPPSPITKPSDPSPKPSPPPTIPTSSVPQSPKPINSVPSSPLATRLVSPIPSPPPPTKETAASPITTTNIARVVTPPVPSPKILKYGAKTPSPKTKPLTPPPSPFTLPPPVLHSDHEHNSKIPPETEQKIVMVHDNVVEKPKTIPPEDNHYNHHNSSNVGKKEKGKNHNNSHKKLSDSEDIGMRVITLAGENTGAIMELTPSQYPRNGHFATNHHRKNGNHDKSWSDGEKLASDSEGKMKNKDKNHSAMTMPFRAYTNSNVQGVNNSILYDCSCTHNGPGVRLTISRKPNPSPPCLKRA